MAAPMISPDQPDLTAKTLPFGVVAIGRNEGERLKQCLATLPAARQVVYVDSASSDGSAQWAKDHGAEVVQLDLARGFTAGRARNAGFARLQQLAPGTAFVQFVDGDCELAPDWPAQAIAFLEERPETAAVFGRLRERAPQRSIYNLLCDNEWNVPVGEVRACGGIAMMRAEAFAAAGGFRDDVIAGEEPELCVRLRAAGWSIQRIDAEMGLHDAAMTRFSQWWRRQTRSGYAFAQGASLHGAPPERHWVWESRRALLWGAAFPLLFAAASILFWPWGLVTWLIYPLQMLRRMRRLAGPAGTRLKLAAFEIMTRFAEARGQLQFHLDRAQRRQRPVIEYK